MPNKSISFNEEMLKAVLDGRKTQTRRIVKPQPYRIMKSRFSESGISDNAGKDLIPEYVVGDIVAVKENKSILLEITNVVIEKLQIITKQDAIKEGFSLLPNDIVKEDKTPSITWFRGLWDSIYGNDESRRWSANPWVWVYEFEVSNEN